MENKKAPNCLLGKEVSCECRNKCLHCGWDRYEAGIRKDAIRNGGLQKDNDGLKRLHVNTKEDPETDADCDL